MKTHYKAKWGLQPDGRFAQNRQFTFENSRFVESDGGKYDKTINLDGVVIPGLVNAHTHLELSYLMPHESGFKGIFEFASTLVGNFRPDEAIIRENARKKLQFANEWGTFYFCDIANQSGFTQFLNSTSFQGLRFLEVLGFCPPFDEQRLTQARSVQNEAGIYFAPHSPYGSSPKIFSEIAGARAKWTSLHLLEDESERDLSVETNSAARRFLNSIGQNCAYDEIKNMELLERIKNSGIFHRGPEAKTLLVHLNAAGKNDIEFIENHCPGAVWVVCQRSSEYLGYARKNWQIMQNTSLDVCLGTDSTATADNVSILHELAFLFKSDVMDPSFFWRAATYGAYEVFNIDRSLAPYYFFPGAAPHPESLLKIKPVKLPSVDELPADIV